MVNSFKDFLKLEASSGIILFVAAVAAMVIANSPLKPYYDLLLDIPLAVQIGKLEVAKPMLLWINDGLMAVFFFLVGLELKREMLEGQLSDRSKMVLPVIAAIGGMAAPAAVYLFFNISDPINAQGWAIPAATDIAFALGILALLGSKVPVSLKVFVVSLAIFDDIGAVLIIAVFYTADLSMSALIVAAISIFALFVLNKRNVVTFTPYIAIGVIMWVAVLKSGVHATLAGVVLALFIPMRDPNDEKKSPVKTLEHDLHGTVAFLILPIFAFANAGIPLIGMEMSDALHPVPIGIALGLFVGKQIGIFGVCFVAIKLGLAKLPENVTWGGLYGVSLLCGVGFTMSLFIGSLAFEHSMTGEVFDERLGIIIGSLISGIAGYLVLAASLRNKDFSEENEVKLSSGH